MGDVKEVLARARVWQDRADASRANQTNLDKLAKAARADAKAAALATIHAEDGQQLLQTVATTVQQTVHKHIAGVVSDALRAVFGPDAYTLGVVWTEARGKTEATLQLERNGEAYDPMAATGGGVVDVAAFALRVAALCMQQPAPRRTVLMDEPFKFVSEGYHDACRQVLETLSAELEIQFIYVTHIPALCGSDVVTLGEN